MYFAVNRDKTLPKSKVPSNWQGMNGWQSCRGRFPCQGIGTSLGKAVLNNTVHSHFLSCCCPQPTFLQSERSGVRPLPSSSHLLLLLKAEMRDVFQAASMQVASALAAIIALRTVDTVFPGSYCRNPSTSVKYSMSPVLGHSLQFPERSLLAGG